METIKQYLKDNNMETTKTKLLAHLRNDADFNKFDDTILKQIVEGMELDSYLLDKKYLDISYIIIDSFIINLDEVYFLCRDF